MELTSKLDGDSTHVSLGEINSEIEVVATLEYYRDDAYPIETSQCAVIHVVPSEGISTVRTSVLPNTKCPIPYYIGELPGDKEAAAAAAAASAGHRSISGFHAYLYVIFMWLLLASYHYLVSPLEQVYELVSYRTGATRSWKGSRKPDKPGTTTVQDDTRNPRCWLISWLNWSWCWWLRDSSSSSMTTTTTTCCGRPDFIRCHVRRRTTKPDRSLKCQLLMFWKLYLIRNYLRIPPHPRCRAWRDRGGRNLTTTPLTRNTAPPPTPPTPLMPTISSQSSLGQDTLHPRAEVCACQQRSTNRSGSNAKTVVRLGTMVVVVDVMVDDDHDGDTDYNDAERASPFLLSSLLSLHIRITNCLCDWWWSWWSWGSIMGLCTVAVAAASRRIPRMSLGLIIVQRAVEFGFAMISRIVCTVEWLICRIEQSKLGASVVVMRGPACRPGTSRPQAIRGNREDSREKKWRWTRNGNRLGLITMIET